MINIDQKEKKVKILLNKDFYNIEIVRKAADEFKEFGKFSVSGRDKISILIESVDESQIGSIGYEFCNYVLGLMKNEAVV